MTLLRVTCHPVVEHKEGGRSTDSFHKKCVGQESIGKKILMTECPWMGEPGLCVQGQATWPQGGKRKVTADGAGL